MFALKVKKLSEFGNINMPALEGDAGFDVYATRDYTVLPHQKVKIPLDIAIEFPKGYMCRIENKSGIASKTNLYNVGGIIDAGYRGNICAIVYNLGLKPETIRRGQKIAQLVFYKIETPPIEFVEELSESERDWAGFGSTGE